MLGASAFLGTGSGAVANPPAATIDAVDYFSGRAIPNVTIAIDGAAIASASGQGQLTPGAGLHSLTVAAAGYATYNGALQWPRGTATRSVALFPVSRVLRAWLAQINADRAANGGSPVALDDMLTIAAYDHAVDMGTRGYFAHFDPHGFAPTTRSLLLGSMMMGAENIAAGYGTWHDAEASFMSERSRLPDRDAADCADERAAAAGHYCNIVWSSHNWVGLADVNVPGSPYGTYYDQEFGDLYGRYDISVPQLSAIGSTVSLDLAPASGASTRATALGVMHAPVAISIATLNADPTCSSRCPAADAVYPAQRALSTRADRVALTPSASELYFVAQYTNVTTYVGAGSWSIAFPSGTIMPDRYTSASYEVTDAATREAAGKTSP